MHIAKVLKSLSDETRIKILQNLVEKGELSCQELSKEFDLSQPTLSHHFTKLISTGVLKERKEGVWRYYSIDKKFLASVGIDVHKLIVQL